MKIFIKNLFFIFSRKEKISFFIFIFFSTISAGLETINISALIPLINVIIDSSNKVIFKHANLDFLNYLFSNNLVINYLLIFLFLFLIKIFYTIIFNWFVLDFLKKSERRLNNNLFKKYLRQPLAFFFRKKTSEILRNLTNETSIFRGSVQDLIELFVEIILLIFIFSLLLIVNPKASLIVVGMVLAVSLIYVTFTKKKIKKWADERLFFMNKYYQNILQTFRLISEIKIFGSSDMFRINNYNNVYNLTNIIHYRNFLKILPKIVLETIGVVFFVLVIYILVKSKSNLNDILVTVGIFLFSAIRILSSSNKLIIIYQNIKNAIPSIKLLSEEIIKLEKTSDDKIETKKFYKDIKLQKIKFAYQNNIIFDNLNLEIKKNSCIGFYGDSGQGKSTLVKILAGLLKPSEGIFLVDDGLLKNNEVLDASIIPQEFNFFEGSIKQNIIFNFNTSGLNPRRLELATNITKLNEKVFKLNNTDLDTMLNDELKNFSGGQLQRIALSRSLYKNSDLIILDEATSALDSASESEIIDLLNELKKDKTIIIFSHNHSNFKICDVVYEIKNKNIFLSDKR